jgi:hypothetical protein
MHSIVIRVWGTCELGLLDVSTRIVGRGLGGLLAKVRVLWLSHRSRWREGFRGLCSSLGEQRGEFYRALKLVWVWTEQAGRVTDGSLNQKQRFRLDDKAQLGGISADGPAVL